MDKQNEARIVKEYGPFSNTTEVVTILNSMLNNPQVLHLQFDERIIDLPKTLVVRWQIMKDVYKSRSNTGKLVPSGIIEDSYYLFVEFLVTRRTLVDEQTMMLEVPKHDLMAAS